MPPSLNVTELVGSPAPGEVTATVALNVTFWPALDGLTEEVTAVVVSALLTTCVYVPELLPLKLLSPP